MNLFFYKCFGDITGCSPVENAAGKLTSQAQKRKKNLPVSTGKQHSSLPWNTPGSFRNYSTSLHGQETLELGLEIIQRIKYSAWPLLTMGVLFILFLMLSANLKIQATPSTSSSLERKAKPTWINFVFTLYNVPVDWFGKCWEGWTNALQSHLDNGHTELKYPCHCRAYPKYLGTRWNCRTTLQPWL